MQNIHKLCHLGVNFREFIEIKFVRKIVGTFKHDWIYWYFLPFFIHELGNTGQEFLFERKRDIKVDKRTRRKPKGIAREKNFSFVAEKDIKSCFISHLKGEI